MVKKRVKVIKLARFVQAVLVLNEGTGGEVFDLARAIVGMITGYNPGNYHVSVSIQQAIDYIDKDPMNAVFESAKMLAVTQIILILAGLLGVPKRTAIFSSDSTIYYLQWR